MVSNQFKVEKYPKMQLIFPNKEENAYDLNINYRTYCLEIGTALSKRNHVLTSNSSLKFSGQF